MTERNIRPKDLLQPPTAITAASLALVLDGSRKLDTPAGKLEVVAGRMGDLVDGFVARKFDMSSDAGAIADVLADKIGMGAIGVSAWQRELVPKPVLVGMAIRHLTSASATLYNGLRDPARRAIRPPKSGKFGMAADTLSVASFMLAHELEEDTRARAIVEALGYTAAVAGLVFGAIATRHYIRGEFADAEPNVT